MKDKTLNLPPDFKNPFENNPDKVWQKIQKARKPLSPEEEKLLRNGKTTLEELRKNDAGK